MKLSRPQFELARVTDNGSSEMEIVPISAITQDTSMNRRGFLSTVVTVTTVLATADLAQSQSNALSATPQIDCNGNFAHTEAVKALILSPDGTTLISGSADNTIKLWSLPIGKMQKTLKGHTNTIYTLAVTPDGKMLVSGAGDQTIKLWSLPRGVLVKTLEQPRNSSQLSLSPNGEILASGTGDNMIDLWRLPQGARINNLKGHTDSVYALAVSPDGTMLASGSADKTLKLWNFPQGSILNTLERDLDATYALAFSPDGKILASAGVDTQIKLWRLPDLAPLKTMQGHKDSIYALAFSPGGRFLVSGSGDGSIKLWSSPEGVLLKTWNGHTNPINALALSFDGKMLVSGSFDKTIKLWSLPEGRFRSCLVDLAAAPSPSPLSTSPHSPASSPAQSNHGGSSFGGSSGIRSGRQPCGTPIPPGAVCTCNCVRSRSSRDLKERFDSVDCDLILKQLATLPIRSWNYKSEDPSIRHIGPMAQDFAAAFGVGDDDKHIWNVDAQGVTFAAIQALYQLIREKNAQTKCLSAQLQQVEERNKTLVERIGKLEKRLRVSNNDE